MTQYRNAFAEHEAVQQIATALAALAEQQRLQLLVTILATVAVRLDDDEHAALEAQVRKGLGLDGGGA